MKMKTGFPESLVFPEVETIFKLRAAKNQYDRPQGFPTKPSKSRFTNHSTPDSCPNHENPSVVPGRRPMPGVPSASERLRLRPSASDGSQHQDK